jgi:hypothetical protein
MAQGVSALHIPGTVLSRHHELARGAVARDGRVIYPPAEGNSGTGESLQSNRHYIMTVATLPLSIIPGFAVFWLC